MMKGGYLNYYNTKELCDLLKVSRNTVKKMRDLKLLPYIRLGKGYLYELNIDEFIERYSGLDLTQIKSVKKELNA